MITIARFSKVEEAHLLRMRLEAGGIPAFVQDEHVVQVIWIYSDAIGGIRVQVAEEDAARARELMEEEGAQPDDAVAVRCPFCNSSKIGANELPRCLAFLFSLLIYLPLFARRQYRCRSCGKRW